MSIARLAEFGRMDSPSSTEAVHIRQPHGIPCSITMTCFTTKVPSLHVQFTFNFVFSWLLLRYPSWV
jgi:hypothetical protein